MGGDLVKNQDVIKAAIYTRVSTTEQAREGYSLEAQEKVLRDYCAFKKYQIVDIYSDEGISGKDIEHRPEMNRLLIDAKARKFNIILVWKLTRFSRKLSDLTKTCDDLEKWNVYLVSYSESFDCSTPAGKMIRNMLGTVAQFEREVIAENVRFGLDARAAKGKRTCSQVLGYDLKGKDSLRINENEAEYVKYVYNSYLTYKSISEVAKLCAEHGYKGKRGRSPTPQSILVILTRPLYCGYNSYCGKLYKGSHETIIDIETFNRVQALLRKQGKNIGRPRMMQLENLKSSNKM